MEAIGVKTFFHYSFFNWDNSVLFPIMTAQIYIPTKSVPGFSSPHPQQYLLFMVCLMTAIWTGVGRYLLVVLICISVVFSGVEHLFMSLLTICMSSWKECLFRSSSLFKIRLVLVFLFVCFELFIYFGYWLLIENIICKYFLPFSGLYFHFVDDLFCCAKAFEFN